MSNVTISKERYLDIYKAYEELQFLEDNGVDNWEGFEDSFESYKYASDCDDNGNITKRYGDKA